MLQHLKCDTQHDDTDADVSVICVTFKLSDAFFYIYAESRWVS
jgi:hypothetical protein